MALEFFATRTRILIPPRDDIFTLFETDGFRLEDGDVLCVASKCLAIHQGRCVKIGDVSKEKLVAAEAEKVIRSGTGLPAKKSDFFTNGIGKTDFSTNDIGKTDFSANEIDLDAKEISLTVKCGVIIANAGIDESNGNGYYVLWPENVSELLRQIHEFLRKKFGIKNLGLISVDSKIEPMRRGTIGVSQGIFGFNPIRDCRGNGDIFGRNLRITTMNLADALAAAACHLMGEGAECRPLVVARGDENIEFGTEFSLENLIIGGETDLFAGVFNF
jgi:F420-0:gamma-glutamyl ligase